MARRTSYTNATISVSEKDGKFRATLSAGGIVIGRSGWQDTTEAALMAAAAGAAPLFGRNLARQSDDPNLLV